MKSIVLVFVILFAGIASAQEPAPEAAQEVKKVLIKFKAGMSDITDADYDYEEELAFGAEFGYMITDRISIGGALQSYSTELDAGPPLGGKIELSAIPFLFETTFYMNDPRETWAPYVGIAAGFTVLKLEYLTLIEEDETEFSFGGKLGVSIPINEKISVGPEFNYLRIAGDQDVNLVSFYGQVTILL